MFSIDEEIRRLAPIDLNEEEGNQGPPELASRWEDLAKALARMGKQQMRANQNVGGALEQGALALATAQEDARLLRERMEDDRWQLQRLKEDGRETRLAALGSIDLLDELLAMARQHGEPFWVHRIEKLVARTTDIFSHMGLSEIAAADRPFDEQVHEAVDVVDRGDREPFTVVEVIRRGFLYDGTVLRRSQVVATR